MNTGCIPFLKEEKIKEGQKDRRKQERKEGKEGEGGTEEREGRKGGRREGRGKEGKEEEREKNKYKINNREKDFFFNHVCMYLTMSMNTVS